MNLCMNGTIESGVETLRARVEYNMGVKGGSEFCSEWHLADLGNNKFVWLGNDRVDGSSVHLKTKDVSPPFF